MMSQLEHIRIKSAYYNIDWYWWTNKITFEQYIRFRNRLTAFLNRSLRNSLKIKQL